MKDKKKTDTRYITKEDLQKKIFGIENYIPGDVSTKDISFAVSSGTTSGKPTLIALTLGKNIRKYFFKHTGVYISLMPRVYLDDLELIRPPSEVQIFMTLSKEDMDHEGIGKIMTQLKDVSIYCAPSFFMYFTKRLLETKSISNVSISSLILTGELFSARIAKKIKNLFPSITFERVDYGSSEAPYLSTHCSYLSEKYGSDSQQALQVYHPTDMDGVSITIADVDESGVGEIIANTNELKNYRTGDAGEIRNEECVCGANKTLIVYGRKHYDVVSCAGILILLTELERIMEISSEYIEEYYVEVKEVYDKKLRPHGEIYFFIVPTNTIYDQAFFEKYMEKHVYPQMQVTQTKSLADAYNEGIITTLKTEVVTDIPQKTEKKIRLKKVE